MKDTKAEMLSSAGESDEAKITDFCDSHIITTLTNSEFVDELEVLEYVIQHCKNPRIVAKAKALDARLDALGTKQVLRFNLWHQRYRQESAAIEGRVL